MDSTDAVKLLEDCEKGLRALVGTAAAEGDYAGIIKLTSWARVLGGLVEDARTESNAVNSPSSLNRVGELQVSARSVAPKAQPSKRFQRGKPSKPIGYPRFFRDAGGLTKIGWSKRERAEYQHKAPHEVLIQLVSKLAVVGAGGAMFTVESVFPLGADEGAPIPNYQAYLCLAWLRHEGLVQAHGRQGYTVSSDENLTTAVNSKWTALAKLPR